MKYVDKNCIDFFFNSFKINFGYKICNGWASEKLIPNQILRQTSLLNSISYHNLNHTNPTSAISSEEDPRLVCTTIPSPLAD